MPRAIWEASGRMGTGARDEQLLWPWVHVTEQASQGLRLNGGLRAAGALSRLPLTVRDPKQREEEEGHGAQDQDLDLPWCRTSARGRGAPSSLPAISLTHTVHWEEEKAGAVGTHHAPLPPPPSWPTTLPLTHLLVSSVSCSFLRGPPSTG